MLYSELESLSLKNQPSSTPSFLHAWQVKAPPRAPLHPPPLFLCTAHCSAVAAITAQAFHCPITPSACSRHSKSAPAHPGWTQLPSAIALAQSALPSPSPMRVCGACCHSHTGYMLVGGPCQLWGLPGATGSPWGGPLLPQACAHPPALAGCSGHSSLRPSQSAATRGGPEAVPSALTLQ